MSLSEKIEEMLRDSEANPGIIPELVRLVMDAPDSPERDGLLALLYHDGIGVERNLDKSFELAEKAAFSENGDGLGYYLLGYMCEHAETPDQEVGGPRQRYDHYDAERFYEKCAGIESAWREEAVLWLGDYYMDFAKGGDPEIGVEYYESIAEGNPEAAGKLSDHFWDLVMPSCQDDEEWVAQLFKWTSVASRLDPEGYTFRMGWLYADGLGCDKDYDKALDYFKAAAIYGDWRGADGVARIYEDCLENNPDMGEDEKLRCEEEMEKWNALADEMYQKDLTDPEKEGDDAIEED